jgi:TonB-dependent starch-binding outer membrane protein SusC
MKILLRRKYLQKLLGIYAKTHLVMKMTTFLLLVTFLQGYATGKAQVVTLSKKNISLEYVFKEINRQTGYDFVYDIQMLKDGRKVNLDVKNEKLETVLQLCFKNQPFSFIMEGNTVVVKQKEIIKQNTVTVVHAAAPPVKGKVKDDAGKPLAGVSVINKNSGKGVSTAADGSFEVDAKKGDVLEFTFVGHAKEIFVVKDADKEIEINLAIAATENAAIVVIGYGKQRKGDITSAVSTVNMGDVAERPVINVGDVIQGKVPGVQIQQPSGKPGNTFTTSVRGLASLTGNTTPVYVVDGFIAENIGAIAPQDIESITVLKDAAAAGIYGASGSTNGVIQITTKKGKKGVPKVAVNMYTGTQTITKKLDLLNSRQLIDLLKDEETNAGRSAAYLNSVNVDSVNNNWQDLIYRKAPMSGVNLSFSGGTEKGSYYLGLGYLDQKGIVITSKYKRYSVTLGLEQEMNNWLSVGTHLSFARDENNDVRDNQSGRFGGFVLSALNTPQFSPVYNQNGDGTYGFSLFSAGLANPLGQIYGVDNHAINNNLLSNVHASVKLPYNIIYRSQLSGILAKVENDVYQDPRFTVAAKNAAGILNYNTGSSFNYVWDNTLTYDQHFYKHAVNLIAGTSTSKTTYNQSYQSGQGFPSYAVRQLSAATTLQQNQTFAQAQSLLSYFAKVNYSYASKYLLSASVRRDGSSRLGTQNQWANFSAFSAGWKVIEENFMKSQKLISDLKLRTSYGATGNLPSSLYSSYSALLPGYNYSYSGSPDVSTGILPSQGSGNPNLRWENTKQFNIGLDVAVLHNRISLAVDYYVKRTKDLIYNVNLPITSGTFVKPDNLPGYVENKGFEFIINANVLEKKQLKWSSSFNMSFNKNLVKLPDNTAPIYTGYIQPINANVAVTKSGESLGSFWGYVAEGVDPQTGNMKYRDLNNDGKITPDADRTVIGNALPEFYYGFTNNFEYKGFALDILIEGTHGGQNFNGTRFETEAMYDLHNQTTGVLKRWKKPGDVTDVPKAIFGDPAPANSVGNATVSSRWIENSSYLRFKSITLSYNLQSKLATAIGLSNIRVYTTLQNFITITKYSGYSPDLNVFGSENNATPALLQGFEHGTYPKAKTITFGINVGL